MEYRGRYLDGDVLMERISEMGTLGLKSIMYAGEGEPFLHKRMVEIVGHTRRSGIDVAMTTNAVLFNQSRAQAVLGDMEWIKVSINAGTAQTYSAIHGTKAADFDLVIKNMYAAARIREDKNYKCALGMQMLLLPENTNEAKTLASIAGNIGMDYFVIKPYSHHLMSKTSKYRDIKYEDYLYLAEELDEFSSDRFNVIFRTQTMKKWDEGGRNYERCLALPFWSYMDAGGGIWGCSAYLGDRRFYYGNIYESSFKDIWEGEERRKSLRWVQEELDTTECRSNCRMDEINRYLWDIQHPPTHLNFI
jgi:MoaA/NifB/PqqE/SkfB family radical SAM enzyme